MPDSLPKYRFLPWTRRGLASVVSQPDVGANLPARAPLSVAITITGVAPAGVNLELYGPGDIVGMDPRLIVRTEPRPNITDFEPNYLAAIEFDLPDLPWMFTPARAGAQERLRPWCVLVVLDQTVVAPPTVIRGAPLPVVTIPSEVRASELPNLVESWAWAHVQVLSENTQPGVLQQEMASQPDLNVSRLVCPRRLAPNRRYTACLVPAFDLGVQRGLGLTPDGTTAKPAWDIDTPGDVKLPVYFHWEFATGVAGDFESLARRLTPTQAPAEMGFQRMFIGAPGGGLADTPAADEAAYLNMEGVLRAPKAANSSLADVAGSMRAGLRRALNAPSEIARGTNLERIALSPPIYGEWHLNRHTVQDAAGPPEWLRELNLDPRMRAAAGLGAEVVRANQEEFMQAAWEQVGDVIQANELLNRARLALDVHRRTYERHYVTLPQARLFQLTSPLHARTPIADMTLRAKITRASLPNASVDPALRRLTSPQRTWLKAVARRGNFADGGSRSVRSTLVALLAANLANIDPNQFMPDGLLGAAILDAVSAAPGTTQVDLSPFGIRAQLDLGNFNRLKATRADLLKIKPQNLPKMVIRPDLSKTGVIVKQPPDALHAKRTRADGDRIKVRLPGTPPLPLPEPIPRDRGTVILPPPNRDSVVVNRFKQAFDNMANAVRLDTPDPLPTFVAFDVQTARNALVLRINPDVMILRRVRTMIGGEAGLTLEQIPGIRVPPTFDRIMAAPAIGAPMYSYLAQYDRERFLPGIGQLAPDSITLLETNPRVIEAFMVGLNYEMNRELLWREYPTDQRGSPIRKFWSWVDGGPDLPQPIHQWLDGALGTHVRGSSQGGQIVLLLRGQLLRRYPNTVIYAWRSQGGKLQDPPAPGDILEPVFRGAFDPDVSLAGFDLRDTDLTEGDGWFFVLQEQPTEPRFGLDETSSVPVEELSRWADASWEHTDVPPGGYLPIQGNPLNGKVLGGVTFGRNSAHLAHITLQKPMRVAIHGKYMVGS